MSNPQKVYDFLKNNPGKLYCDDCLQNNTGVDRHQVNTIATTLALFPQHFKRLSTACVQGCRNHGKMATEALGPCNRSNAALQGGECLGVVGWLLSFASAARAVGLVGSILNPASYSRIASSVFPDEPSRRPSMK